MLTELEGLEGVICIMHDILVHGKTQEQHDDRLEAVLPRLTKARITLNPEKCEFSRRHLKFAGHMLSAQGIGPDRDKTAAIEKMESPQNVPKLRRLLRMINRQQKFMKNLSDKTSPFQDLLSSKNEWHWGPAQETAFQRLKNDMSQAPVLAHYCPEKDTIVSADASSYGLGAVLLQVQDDGSTKATAYASRSLTSTEQRYAQIEKEALATTWACEKFADYILGKEFKIETDHKPLIPLLGSKCLQDLPPKNSKILDATHALFIPNSSCPWKRPHYC